jgi:histidinol-phosphate aminotransferase
MSAPFHVQELIGERVRGLQGYAPEPPEEAAQRLGIPVGQLIKLDANENPYGPTRHTLGALSGYSAYHRYPDAISRRLREAIGRYVGIAPASVLVGNGSDELIDTVLRLFRPGPRGGGIAQVVNCPPTFGEYQFYAVTNDMGVQDIPRDDEFRVNVSAIESLCRSDPQPKVVFLASPNSPDGSMLPDVELMRLLALPLVVVLDEAYIEFSSSPSKASLVGQHDNLIVLRTFSKWAGLAGLRVGYGVFPACLMAALWRLKSPYNVNCAAQVAALATLDDLAESRAVIGKIVAERERFLAKLREIPYLRVRDSQANFIYCKVEGLSVEAVKQAMERRGIILRYFSDPAMRDCIRISVGTPMQDESVLIGLRALERQGGPYGK